MRGIQPLACRQLTGLRHQNTWCILPFGISKVRFPLRKRMPFCSAIMKRILPAMRIIALRKLFTGIYSHAGRICDYNIMKKEWVLDGATVLYGSATELKATLHIRGISRSSHFWTFGCDERNCYKIFKGI